MHFTTLALLTLSLTTPLLAAPYPYAWAEPEPADSSLSSDIDSALNSFESSLQLIQDLNGVDACDVATCIADMAPALTQCSTAQAANFSNPQQDVACLGDVVNAAEGFTAACGACLTAAEDCAAE
ncbi:hypothetical protein MMC10_007061 [Thelotrema lepadinum]|nr:hypothetical protein [Thelotrema lepadinum]